MLKRPIFLVLFFGFVVVMLNPEQAHHIFSNASVTPIECHYLLDCVKVALEAIHLEN